VAKEKTPAYIQQSEQTHIRR